MSTQLISERVLARSRTARARLVAVLGPLTMLGGVAWSFLQPYRLTVLHPHGQGFWWLLVEPPILVALVGVLFHLLVAPGLVSDVEEAEIMGLFQRMSVVADDFDKERNEDKAVNLAKSIRKLRVRILSKVTTMPTELSEKLPPSQAGILMKELRRQIAEAAGEDEDGGSDD